MDKRFCGDTVVLHIVMLKKRNVTDTALENMQPFRNHMKWHRKRKRQKNFWPSLHRKSLLRDDKTTKFNFIGNKLMVKVSKMTLFQ